MPEDPRPHVQAESEEVQWLFGDESRRADYGNRLKEATEAAKAGEQRFNRIAFARLLVVFLGIALAIGAWAIGLLASLAVVAIAAGIFFWLTVVHERVSKAQRRAAAVAEVNAAELERMQGKLDAFPTGDEFLDPHHAYTDDLDLFGPRAIFSRINRAGTSFGRQRLAEWLHTGAGPQEVARRQEAVRELSSQIDLLQALQAETSELSDSDQDPTRIREWLASHPIDTVSLPPRVLLILAAALILTTIGLAFALVIPSLIPVLVATAGWFAAANGRKFAAEALEETRGLAAILERYAGALAVIEQAPVTSELLTAIKSQLGTTAPASTAIPKLQAILDCLEVRNNPVMHFPLDTVGFWDLHCLHRLKNWRDEFAKSAPTWLDALAEFEAIGSLATLAANHPDWAFPELLPADSELVIDAKSLGHPLIPDTISIPNDLKLTAGQVLLITGSNMAGKSTFMRSVGVGLVLARTGAPVCAKSFRCRATTPWTSMRTRDSLVDSESTFYAELRRLKQIIEVIEGAPKKNVFILDEVLRGTNSRDRHLGADALLRQLAETGGTGMLATHDLQLADLAKDHPEKVQLVCFESKLESGRLLFDYTIRKGVCENLNASYLMKNMGIKIRSK